jgi:hypothetical protein
MGASAQRDSSEILDYAHQRVVEQKEHLSRNYAVISVTWHTIFVGRSQVECAVHHLRWLASPDTIKSLLKASGDCREVSS